jgi:hypothetical protein
MNIMVPCASSGNDVAAFVGVLEGKVVGCALPGDDKREGV